MKNRHLILLLAALLLLPAVSYAAYHHEGENDSKNFLAVYPDLAGTKLDHCALCHKGGTVTTDTGKTLTLGSCQYCHEASVYGYSGTGNIANTFNGYGQAYRDAGSTATAIRSIENMDSDNDGHLNKDEIAAVSYPGNGADYPGLQPAPARVYTKGQLMAMGAHTEFLMMNTSRSGDFYAEYTGVPMKTLLDDAGILETATTATVYSLDAWSQTHPLDYTEGGELYHLHGNMPDSTEQYPQGTFRYHSQADAANGGWCDYNAPSCQGRSDGDLIAVAGGLKAILAYAREGAPLDPGVINSDNRLDGEGPFRVVVPQKDPSPPDQSSKADDQSVYWPYVSEWDHNAGACSKSVTFIRVEPMPAGTTDIDVYEDGWRYVDEEKIVIYGAIDGADSNGNGILDSEEAGGDAASDMDENGTPDYQDPHCARFRHVNGNAYIGIYCSEGELARVQNQQDGDGAVPQANKPAGMDFPYGVFDYQITGVAPGQEVVVTYVLPEALQENAQFYKISTTGGWVSHPFESAGENRILITLKDGDPATDADGEANGTIVDPAAIGVPAAVGSGGSSSGGCFIDSLFRK